MNRHGPPILVRPRIISQGEIQAKEDKALRRLELAQKVREPEDPWEPQPKNESMGDKWGRLGRILRKYINPLQPFQARRDVLAAREQGVGRFKAAFAGMEDELKLIDQANLFFDPIAETFTAGVERASRIPIAGLPFKGAAKVIGVPTSGPLSERTQNTRATLRKMLFGDGGDISLAEGAGLLRSNFTDRKLRTQLIMGVLTDPTIVLGPIKLAKAGATAAQKLGAVAVRPTFRGALTEASKFTYPAMRQVAEDASVRATGKRLEDLLPVAGGLADADLPRAAEAVGDALMDATQKQAFHADIVERQVQGSQRLMDDLFEKGDLGSLRDRAVIMMMRATGMRPGRVFNLAWRDLKEGLRTGHLRETVIEEGARLDDDILEPLTGRTVINEERLHDVQQALDDYRRALVKAGGDLSDDARLLRVGDKGKLITQSTATSGFARRFRGFRAAAPDLPEIPKNFRRLYAREILMNRMNLSTAQRLLGHASPKVTREFYWREFGADLEALDAVFVRELQDVSPVAREKLADVLAKQAREINKRHARGLRARSKGSQPFGAEADEAAQGFGDSVIGDLPLSDAHARTLSLLEGETAELFEGAARLNSMGRFLVRIGRLREIQEFRVANLKRGLGKSKGKPAEGFSLKNLDPDEATRQGNLFKQELDLADADVKLLKFFENNLKRFAQRRGDEIDASRIRLLTDQGVQEILTPGNSEAIEDILREFVSPLSSSDEGVRAAMAIKGRRAALATTKAILRAGASKHIEGVSTRTAPADLAPMLVKWVREPTIHDRFFGLIDKDMSANDIFGAFKRIKTEGVFGPDFAALSDTLKNERLNRLAAGLWSDRELMKSFRFKAKRVKPEREVELPPPNPPRDPPGSRSDLLEDGGFQPHNANTVLDIEYAATLLRTSEGLQSASARLERALGPRARSIFESTFGAVHGGIAPWLGRPGRLVGGLLHLHDRAKALGGQVSDGLAQRWSRVAKQHGLRSAFEEPRARQPKIKTRDGKVVEIGGSWLRFSEGLIKVKRVSGVAQVHPELERHLRGFYSEAEIGRGAILNHMRDYDMVLDQVHFNDWDKYYEFASPEVRTALTYSHHVVAELEDLMETGRKMFGFDIRDFMNTEKRIVSYHPRMKYRTDQAAAMRERSNRVTQAQPSFFLDRKHPDYWDAITDGDLYENGLDSLGLYTQTVHQMLAEWQARNAMRGLSLEMATGETTRRAAMALRRIQGDLLNPNEVTSAEEFRKALSQVEAHPQLNIYLEDVLKDPAGMADTIDSAVKRAVRDQINLSELQQHKLGAEWAKDLFWSEKDWDQIKKLTEVSTSRLFKIAESLQSTNQVIRFLRAGFDLGVPLIHGFPVFFRNPEVWLKATKHHYQTFWNPDVHRAFMDLKNDVVREMQSRGSTVGTRGEPFEIAARSGSLDLAQRNFEKLRAGGVGLEGRARKLFGKERLYTARNTPIGAFERFEGSFTGFLDHVQVSMYEGMKREGMSAVDLEDLTAFINKMTGTYNTTLTGLTPSTRVLQSGMLFFAPMYRRAAYGLLLDVGRGKIRGPAARRAVGSMLAGGAAMSYLMGELTGNPQSLDPSSPRFMTMKIGEFNIGFGTAYYSLVRLAANLFEVGANRQIDIDQGDEAFDFSVPSGSLEKDVRNQARTRWHNWPDNQLFKWFRGQASPLAAGAADLAIGRTFLGDRLVDEGGLKFGNIEKHMQVSTLPFWADRETVIAAGGGTKAAFAAIGGEFLGLRSIPLGVIHKSFEIKQFALENSDDPEIVAWRDGETATGREPIWKNTPVLFKQRMSATNPALQEIEQAIKEADISRGSELQRDFIKYREEVQIIRNILREGTNPEKELGGFERLAASWDLGLKTDREFRDERTTLLASHRALTLQLNDRFPSIMEEFETARMTRDPSVTFIGDAAFDSYMTNVINSDDTSDELGNFQRDQFDAVLESWRAENGITPEIWDYVRARLTSKQDLPPILQEFEEDREGLTEYWDLHETMSNREADIIRQYLSRKDNINKSLFLNSHLTIRAAVKRWEGIRERYRQQHPEADWLLAKWYGNAPSTPFALKLFNERQVKWGKLPKSIEMAPRARPKPLTFSR